MIVTDVTTREDVVWVGAFDGKAYRLIRSVIPNPAGIRQYRMLLQEMTDFIPSTEETFWEPVAISRLTPAQRQVVLFQFERANAIGELEHLVYDMETELKGLRADVINLTQKGKKI